MSGSQRAMLVMFLVTSCVLAFEVALTRVCSVLLQYHISFAVVSYAVLGLGLGGFLAYVSTRQHPERVVVAADVALLSVAPLMLLALTGLLTLPFASHWPYLLALVLPAFMAAGAFQSLMLREWSNRAGSLYAADLLGGACGALGAVLALDWLRGPVHTILFVALLLAAGAWGLRRTPHPAARLAGPSLAGVLLLAVLAQGMWGVFSVSYEQAPHKLITQLLREQPSAQLLTRLQRWDAYSRVDVLERWTPHGAERLVFIDGETPTAMLGRAAKSPGRAPLPVEATLPALPYRLFGCRDVLSIGSGAGYDVLVATRSGAEHVDAVELNAGVLKVVEAEKAWTGDVYGQPGVRVHHDEGRLFARRAPAAAYDLILLALAQSLAGNLHEYALSENYLYTQEAFADYLRVLREDGTVAMLLNNPMFMRKLARTAIEVLDARGVRGEDCVAVVTHADEAPYDQLLLVRKRPFHADELARLDVEIERSGYTAVHVPASASARYTAEQLHAGAYRLQPASDDRPFFFNVYHQVPPGLRPLLWFSGALLLAGWLTAAGMRRGGATAGFLQAGYFVLLGLAFMMVEVLVLQKSVRLVGFPTLNLGVVLATFLLAAGLGSAASQRLSPTRHPLAPALLLAVLAVLLIGIVPLLDVLYARFDAAPLALRCTLMSVVLAPFAFVMGMPFPLGLRLLHGDDSSRIPWFWGLNGVASILGSATVVAVVLELGFQRTALLPAILYLVAAALALGLRRPAL